MPWKEGSTLFNFISSVQVDKITLAFHIRDVLDDRDDCKLLSVSFIQFLQFDGLTGPIKFKEGKRVDFKLDLLKLKTTKLTKVRIREGWVTIYC